MQITLYGATDIGYLIVSHLCREHDVTVIDEAPRLPERFDSLDISHLVGSGADLAVLERARPQRSDLFIACSTLDEANVVACWSVKKIAPVKTVCFVSRAELYHNLNSELQHTYQTQYDIDTVIWPEKMLTEDIFRTILVPEAVDVEYFDSGRVKLCEYRIKEGSPLAGVRIMDYPFPANVLAVGIMRCEELFIPNGRTTIEAGDKALFMGTGTALDLLAAAISTEQQAIGSVGIIGGGSVGYHLAQQLEEARLRVKVLEQSEERCRYLADHLARALVIRGDGTDLALLEEEGVGTVDVLVCVTDNDEKNLLCSLLARQLGVRRVVTRLGNRRNQQLFERVGVDVIVSAHESALRELLNQMQARDVDLLALVEGGRGEVLRIGVPESFTETRVMDLKFPATAVIGVILRGRSVLIPNGLTRIRGGDRLKVFTLSEHAEAIRSLFTR